MTDPASLHRAHTAARAADAKGAQEILILDLREQTLVTDFFVICTATSGVHLRAVRTGVEEEMERAGHRFWGREGSEDAQWILLDYGDVVVHVFTEQRRAFYKLERMWSNAPVITVPTAPRV